MSGDVFKPITSGDVLRPSARVWNRLMELCRRGDDISPGNNSRIITAPTIPVRNDTTSGISRWQILGIDGPVITPTDNESEFAHRIILSAVAPVAPDHEGRFVIAAGAIPAGGVGQAYVSGVCPVKVNVTDEVHRFADVADGVTGYLATASTGAAAILWRESGTGEKWAIVHLSGALPPMLFPVLITKDGGVAGSASADCSFTYTVKDLAGVELASGLSPECGRLTKTEYAEPSADSPAVAYRDAAGDLHLYHVAGEVPVTKTVAVVTSFRYDTTTHAFQLKKTAVRVLEKADEDAEWTDIVALTECNDT